MKNPMTDSGLFTAKFVARFGGRFLCRSPPVRRGYFFCAAVAGALGQNGALVADQVCVSSGTCEVSLNIIRSAVPSGRIVITVSEAFAIRMRVH